MKDISALFDFLQNKSGIPQGGLPRIFSRPPPPPEITPLPYVAPPEKEEIVEPAVLTAQGILSKLQSTPPRVRSAGAIQSALLANKPATTPASTLLSNLRASPPSTSSTSALLAKAKAANPRFTGG